MQNIDNSFSSLFLENVSVEFQKMNSGEVVLVFLPPHFSTIIWKKTDV